MTCNEYGRTGMRVSAIGFGGMRFDTRQPREKNAELLHYAFAQGITYFDTAPGYCRDQSEDIFGIALRDLPRERVIVSTKGMPTDFGTAAEAYEAVCRSLERLGIDAIDLYHVWCLRRMEHYELAMRPGGQYEGLLRCRDEGLIRHIACSTHQPGHEVARILSRDEFAGVLLGVNILNFPYRWDGVEEARARGCGIVAMNPLAGGAIPQHEKEFAFLARPGETPTEAAIRFLVAAPQIDVALVGFTTTDHIDTAVRAARDAGPLGADERTALRASLGANLTEICTGCGYCRGCPENIPVAGYMQVYNERVMFHRSDEQMRSEVRHHYSWGILVGRQADAEECTECGRCEEACTQHLPIMERLREFRNWKP
ncbi:MAG: aldo/keto reductase [Lentisphaeria bacterium]|nr:aldo/keto reductase [Lentisphaeria bacterium]